MSNQPNVIEATADIAISALDAFRLITKKEIVERITGLTVRSDIADKGDTGNGVITIGNSVFFARYAPLDIELNSTQVKVKLRIEERGESSRILAAAAVPIDSPVSLTAGRLQSFIDNFKVMVEQAAPKRSEAIAPTESSEKRRDVFRASDRTKEDEGAVAGSPPKKKPLGKKKRRARAIAILVVLLILIAVGMMIFYHFRGIVTSTDMSYRVTFDTAKSIEPGMTKSQVAFNLGTNGIADENDENRIVYRSVAEHEGRLSAEMISVIYGSGDRVESVSYLNTKNANSVYKIISFNVELTPEMTVDQVVEAAGIPMSLYRRYNTAEGQAIEEVHFGYLDPTANFNPAWRGEFVVLLNRTDNTLAIQNWGYYDGSDPTMTGSIAGTPFENQYDNYTDFLNDRFQYSRALLLLNGYSLGDTKYFFDSEPVHYSDDYGYHFYSIDSTETLPGTETPLYRISIGYDGKGAFRMASFSNTRLYNKSGTLADSDYRLLTRGMSYNEVRELMRLVPTAIYIDSSYFSVCYGRFLNTDVADEQFEVIVRFDIANNYAQKVLINTAVSNVADGGSTPPTGDSVDPATGGESLDTGNSEG